MNLGLEHLINLNTIKNVILWPQNVEIHNNISEFEVPSILKMAKNNHELKNSIK
jgi:hypothetical protein